MTAESQLNSVKILRAFVKRGFQPLVSRRRHKNLTRYRLDGNFAKRLFDVTFSLSVLMYISLRQLSLSDLQCFVYIFNI